MKLQNSSGNQIGVINTQFLKIAGTVTLENSNIYCFSEGDKMACKLNKQVLECNCQDKCSWVRVTLENDGKLTLNQSRAKQLFVWLFEKVKAEVRRRSFNQWIQKTVRKLVN